MTHVGLFPIEVNDIQLAAALNANGPPPTSPTTPLGWSSEAVIQATGYLLLPDYGIVNHLLLIS